MPFGSSKKEAPGVDVYSPFGSIQAEGKDLIFNPVSSKQLNRLEKLAVSKQLKALKRMPDNMGFNAKLADRFFDQAYRPALDALQQPLQHQHRVEQRDLVNELSARNQFGSSFEAMQRDLLARRQGDQLSQAANLAQSQARSMANALAMQDVNARVQNGLNTLKVFQALRDAYLKRQLVPLQLAPLQQQLTGQIQRQQEINRRPFGLNSGLFGLRSEF